MRQWIRAVSTVLVFNLGAYQFLWADGQQTALAPSDVNVSSICSSKGSWTHYAGRPARNAIASTSLIDLDNHLEWVVGAGSHSAFVGPSTPVVFDQKVFAYANVYDDGGVLVNSKIIAFDIEDGGFLWETLFQKAAWDSWSSPAVDTRHRTVIIGSNRYLYALDIDTGALRWQQQLDSSVANASPVVTTDLSYNRALITDIGFGSAKLYCINVDSYDSVSNPYQPGDRVWAAVIGGAFGSTPAYHGGVVYVADSDGQISAYDTTANSGTPLWVSQSFGNAFYGGIVFRQGYLYAATYNFNGSGDNSMLVKVNAQTGQTVWTVPSERTDSTPVIAGSRIYLSAGLDGFGSAPKLQAFEDQGESAVKIWDTYDDTGGNLYVGGWSHQPVYANGRIYVGTLPPYNGSDLEPYIDMYVLDAAKTPGQPGFIIDYFPDAGSSPAVLPSWIFSFGPNGLHAFHQDNCSLAIDAELVVPY